MASEEKAEAARPHEAAVKGDDASEHEQIKPLANFTSFFRLLFYANPTWLDVALIAVGTIAAAAAGVPFPLMGIVFGQLLDDLNSATCELETSSSAYSFESAINSKVLTLVYLAVASFVLIYIYLLSWSLVSQRLAHRLRELYFESILRQDAAFFDRRKPGEISSRLSADIQAVQSGTSEKLGVCIASTAFFVTAYAVGFAKDAKLAGMLVALVPAFVLTGLFGGGYIHMFSSRVSDHLAAASSIAAEALDHIMVVKAFDAAARIEKKLAASMTRASRDGIKKALATAVQAGMVYFIAYSANALAFWQGSKQVADTVQGRGDGTTVGEIYTVVFIIVDACVILGQIAPLIPLLGGAATAFQKLQKDIDSRPRIDSSGGEGRGLDADSAASVEFRNVTFSYASRGDAAPALRDVSFVCPAGKKTAIVGASGSGKSTIASLIARLYDPDHGEVLMGGRNSREYRVSSLRGAMSFVQQDHCLLDRSILENIALGLGSSENQQHAALLRSGVLSSLAEDVRNGHDFLQSAERRGSDVLDVAKRIVRSAEIADAAGFVSTLSLGFGTEAGPSGSALSGGQRQRVSLARAIMREPRILILDEATASLDFVTESKIQAQMDGLSPGLTMIAITHRLSSVAAFDNIVVLDKGRVVEQGTHEELVSLGGAYAEMVALQSFQSESAGVASSSSSAREVSTLNSMSDFEDKAVPKGEASVEESSAQDDGEPAASSGGGVWKRIWKLSRPNLRWLVLAIFAASIVGCTFLAAGLVFGHTVGRVSPCSSPSLILYVGQFFGGIFFMIAVVELLANTASWTSFGIVSERFLLKIRVSCFRALLQQNIEWHQGNEKPAALLAVIAKDSAAIGGFSGSVIGTIFSIVVSFVAAVVLSHVIAWKIAIVCLVTVPILLGAGLMQLRSLARFEERHAGAFASSVALATEAVRLAKTVASFSLEQQILQTYRRALGAPRQELLASSAYANLWLAISSSTANMIYAFAYWWGSSRIMAGEYTQTEFFIILVSMLVSAQLWGQMFTLAPEVSKARLAISRVFSLIDLGRQDEDPEGKSLANVDGKTEKDVEATAAEHGPSPARPGMRVSFREVNFTYPGRAVAPSLQDATFSISPGSFCGIVGPSGAGKSTIMALVQGLYVPTSGQVELDGQSTCNDSVLLRDDIAMVPQDSALFDGSVKFNVGLGARHHREATDAEIEEACRLANIHDTIVSLPQGYDTECGPGGTHLSGGQRQRVAIARALVRKPRLLLLDESTSALDAESERLIQEGIERASRGTTVVAITHRLHTVRRADCILVVSEGRIVDSGTHEELLHRSDTYRENAMREASEK